MMFAAGLTALALTSAAAAQLTIQVGAEQTSPGGIFQYIPNNGTAPNGTVVTFQFLGAPGNHTVTQSSFADPCNPLAGGFDSGWILIPTAGTPNPVPEWNLTITDDTKPIWFFCKQLSPLTHCSAGMVGGINIPATSPNTLADFQKNAIAFKGNSGQGIGALVGVGASASAGIGPVPTGATLFGAPSGAGAATSGTPTATSPPGTGSPRATTTGGASTTTTTSSASSVGASIFSAAFAALLGISFA